MLVPAGIGWDFANFHDAGRRVAAGRLADIYDPTSSIAGEPPSTQLEFVGTPLSAFLYAPLGLLRPEAALIAFKLAGTLAVWAALALLYRAGRERVGPEPGAVARHAARFACAALLFQPFWTVYRVGGQTTPFVLLLLTAGLLAHVRGRAGRAALCFALAVVVKPGFAPGLAILALVAGGRFLAFAALHGAWLGALSVAVAGWPLHEAFLGKMTATSAVVARWTYNSSLWIVPNEIRWWSAGGTEPAPLPSWLTLPVRAAFAALCGALAWAARRRLDAPAARVHWQWIVALTFVLLSSPTVWEHYLAVLFLPVAHWLAEWDGAPREVRRGVVALVLLATLQNLAVALAVTRVLPEGNLPAVLAVTIVKSAPVAVMLWLLLRCRPAWEAAYLRAAARPI